MGINLNFKYGTGVIPATSEQTRGNVYIKKIGNTRAKMFIDSPIATERLTIGGDVFVGDPDVEGSGADDYDVIINPDGDIINNVVTSEQAGGFMIRVVSPSNPDTYIPQDNPNSNMITLVI